MNKLKPYMKAVVLTAIIAVTLVADILGAPVGLDAEHYIGLLIADVAVWGVRNKEA